MMMKSIIGNISKCVRCGTFFEIKRSDSSGKFCSRICSYKTRKNQPAKLFKKVCPVCEKTFTVQSESNARLRKTCSRKCATELKKIYGKEHPLYRRVDMPCEICGQIKAVKRAKTTEFRFCSRRCQGIYTSKSQPKISSIEMLMKSQFDLEKLKYEQQFIIGCYITDFAFPENKLVVECDGIYWHGSEKQKSKDRQKDGFLKHHGWEVLRLDEIQIKGSPKECLDLVLAKIQSRQAAS